MATSTIQYGFPVEVAPITYNSEIEFSNKSLFARKSGRTVTVNGWLKFASAQTGTVSIGTIGEGCRPADNVRISCALASEAYLPQQSAGYTTISSDGGISINMPSGNPYRALYFSCAYIAQN